MKTIRLLLIAALTLVAASSCDLVSSNEPSTHIEVSGRLSNTSGAQTILKFDVLYDGRSEMAPSTVSATDSVGLYSLFYKHRTSVLRGHHTVTVRILNQSASPSSYALSGVYVALLKNDSIFGGTFIDGVFLPDMTGSVATGSGMTVSFDR